MAARTMSPTENENTMPRLANVRIIPTRSANMSDGAAFMIAEGHHRDQRDQRGKFTCLA